MGGRRPQAGASWRDAHPAEVLAPLSGAVPVADGPVEPPDIAASPEAHATWLAVVGDGRAWRPEDGPLIASWCMWAAIAASCRRQLERGDGLALMVRDGTKSDGSGGRVVKSPLVLELAMASNQLRQIGAELGITPLARARLGIAEAATASMQMDVMAKMRDLAARVEFTRP